MCMGNVPGQVRIMRQLYIQMLKWPTKGVFRIAHDTLTEIPVIEVKIMQDGTCGYAECRPYSRYNETLENVKMQMLSIKEAICDEIDINILQTLLPAGAARNGLECALWDLQAKLYTRPVHEQLGICAPRKRTCCFTLSIDTPENMAKAAKEARHYPILKIKIDGLTGLEAITAIHRVRSDAKLIIDANESLSPENLPLFLEKLVTYPVIFIEQPLPTRQYTQLPSPLPTGSPPICADESLHTHHDLIPLWQAGYRAINVKLDKSGGVSEALKIMRTAQKQGFIIMAGCMAGSSLAMAPMMMLESYAHYIDLDGPLLLREDRPNGLQYEHAILYPPTPDLWG